MISQAAIIGPGQVVYTGKSHAEILKNYHMIVCLKNCEQGFVDTAGRFYNRQDAGEYAISCGQIKKLKYHKTYLFSEELNIE